MSGSIDRDKQRFLDIIRKRNRETLLDKIRKGELIGKIDGKTVKVPYDIIELPRIRYSEDEGEGGGDEGEGGGDVGDQPGKHQYEEFSVDEVAKIIGEYLHLPRIKPNGHARTYSVSEKLDTVNPVGPPGRMHKKRTFKNALRRSMASGGHYHGKIVYPVRPDRIYKSFRPEYIPDMNAVIFYIMDVSGSMGHEQKERLRTMNFLIDVWLSYNYKSLESRYIIHDTLAREVDKNTFYHTRESGGTMISSAFIKQAEIMHKEYRPEDWNIYILYGSDGDNWDNGDTERCFDVMDKSILPNVNLMGYVQTTSPYGSGQFLTDLRKRYGLHNDNSGDSKILTSIISKNEDIMPAIMAIFGKGK